MDSMSTARRPAPRPRDLFRRGVGSILEIAPPRSRFHELVPSQTADEAFARYRADLERYLGAAVARWEAEEGGAPAAEPSGEPFPDESFPGPLPSLELLRRCEEAVPGAGERILALAEQAQEQEQGQRVSRAKAALGTLRRGQLCGLAMALGALGVVAFAVYLGHPVVATILGGTTLTGLVAVFVAGRPGGSREERPSEPAPPEG